MNNQHKINEVLEALGDEQLSTGEIVPRLKEFSISPRSLTYFMNEYMVHRYVEKERIDLRVSGSQGFINKFRRIATD